MAKNVTVSQVDRVVAELKARRSSPIVRGSLVERIVDAAADSGRALSRIGAGFAAAAENAALAFEVERERQTRRTAERLLAQAS